MIQNRTIAQGGKKCPKCGNYTVFENRIFRNLIIYMYTAIECTFAGCGYHSKRKDK